MELKVPAARTVWEALNGDATVATFALAGDIVMRKPELADDDLVEGFRKADTCGDAGVLGSSTVIVVDRIVGAPVTVKETPPITSVVSEGIYSLM